VAGRIEIFFGVKTPGDPWNTVLKGSSDPHTMREEEIDAAFTKLLWPLVYRFFLTVAHDLVTMTTSSNNYTRK